MIDDLMSTTEGGIGLVQCGRQSGDGRTEYGPDLPSTTGRVDSFRRKTQGKSESPLGFREKSFSETPEGGGPSWILTSERKEVRHGS